MTGTTSPSRTQAAFEDVMKDCGAEFRLMPGDIRADLQSKSGLRKVAQGADLLMLQRVALVHGYPVARPWE